MKFSIYFGSNYDESATVYDNDETGIDTGTVFYYDIIATKTSYTVMVTAYPAGVIITSE